MNEMRNLPFFLNEQKNLVFIQQNKRFDYCPKSEKIQIFFPIFSIVRTDSNVFICGLRRWTIFFGLTQTPNALKVVIVDDQLANKK